jgi:hypothetical protein
MSGHLLLHCDSTNTLAQEGTDTRKQFSELREALEYAASTISEVTRIRLYNDRGRVIVESTIHPRQRKGVDISKN